MHSARLLAAALPLLSAFGDGRADATAIASEQPPLSAQAGSANAQATLLTELMLSAYPDAKDIPQSASGCRIDTATNCAGSLSDLIALSQNRQWQQIVSGRYQRVTIKLTQATYRIAQPFKLRWGTGLTQGVALEISGAGASTVLSGAVVIPNWNRAPTHLPSRVSAKARSKIWLADVKALLPNRLPQATPRGYGLPIMPMTAELFVGTTIQPIASWPDSGFGKIAVPKYSGAPMSTTFSIEGRSAADWQDEPDLRAHGFWQYDWADQNYIVDSVDASKNTLTLAGTGSPYGIKAGQRVRIENSLHELDSPGEWYLDRNTKIIYWIPPVGFNGQDTEISITPNIFNIENSNGIHITNLSIEKLTGDGIQVNNSSNIHINQVNIRLTGNRALTIEDSNNSGINNCNIEDNGEGGITISGGNRKTLQAAMNFVKNCSITRYSRLAKTMKPAIQMEGVGHQILSNTISDAPHMAIYFKGNDHLIAKNEIFNVVNETGDAGAIYVGRDYTVEGTVIENNFFHDIKTRLGGAEVKGVYIDDQASGITVRSNTFARVQQPVFIGGGRDNVIENNLFFMSTPALHVDARGLTSDAAETHNPAGTLQQGLRAVPYKSSTWSARYPRLATIQDDQIGAPKYNTFKNNTLILSAGPSLDKIAQPFLTISGNRHLTEASFATAMPSQKRIHLDDFRLTAGN
ncbi:right-handed parallel beta-helix repeat-containing protein [Roseateles koreensis]|uniref:Right-handed parallel beta-helix repeat-containing protein n=1 Tax=Roseateles koreensis TaxID=2987526 RepID=A0ABT5KUR9_9BURK|nr:right-handed parallel beta-helix repeat-containing protein [Roseateles koreensis]MDC8786686.1 right-handed parallel beta-helix repeat-containing protein [Roseateles koreensis]